MRDQADISACHHTGGTSCRQDVHRIALRIAEHGEGEAALLGLAVADGQMVVGGEDVDGERAEALDAVLAAAAGAERQEAGQQGLEHVEDVLPFRAGREVVGHGDRWLDRLSMAFSALMAVGWVSSSGANVMARRSRWSISALMKELLPPPPAP